GQVQGKGKNNAFNIQTAIFLAAVCGQAYCQFDNPDGTFLVPAKYDAVSVFKGLSFDEVSEWFGFILESKEKIIVAFRGTSTTADWISNSIARQEKFKYVRDAGWTHSGFTRIYTSIRPQIRSVLKELPDHKTLYVTGHSLGGALASLCALDSAVNTPFHNPRLYTYGSPRVGDPAFVKALGRTIACSHRVANPYDLVPHLPPIVYRQPRTKDYYYYMQVKQAFELEFKNNSIADNHKIQDYFQALSQLDPAYAKAMCKINAGFCP
ncbi:MAG: lipase, partial [Paenibacillus sp.]|nr:lipase [Paenibacillus sp.]